MAAAYSPQAELLRIMLIAGGAVGAGSSWQDLREILMAMQTPEALARVKIDATLAAAGWCVQDAHAANLHADHGVAVREFPLPGFGEADYLLFAGGQAVGAVEAKKEGATLADPDLIAAEIVEDLRAALEQFELIQDGLVESAMKA